MNEIKVQNLKNKGDKGNKGKNLKNKDSKLKGTEKENFESDGTKETRNTLKNNSKLKNELG